MTAIAGHSSIHLSNVDATRYAKVAESDPGGADSWAPTAPHFVDFSMPIAHVNSWAATSDDVIEASVAVLMSKERKLCNILHKAIEACGQAGAMPPIELVESEETFAGHWAALAALHPVHTLPVGRGVHRMAAEMVHRLRKIASRAMARCVSYPSRLYELYVAASDVSIAYIALQSTALALGDRCAAAVAARHLRHSGQLLLMLHTLVPYASVRELQTHGFSATTEDLWEVSGVPAPG